MVNIAIAGVLGRMGQALVELIEQADGAALVAGIARRESATGDVDIHLPAAARAAIEACDVLIDFSTPDALRALLEQHGAALAGRGLVVGTTGLDVALEARLDEAAERTAVLTAANFSIGVHVLTRLAAEAARLLPADDWDVEIVDVHHRAKADAPSGTALALGRAVAASRGARLEDVRRNGRSGTVGARPRGEVAFHAVRGGGVVGEHTVCLLSGRERITLGHAALDRTVFAEGALVAARWIAGRAPGRYTLSDVLGPPPGAGPG